MGYLKIADTLHGELGHNGWTWVLNNPFPHGDTDHPAYYEETGRVHEKRDGFYVEFRQTFGLVTRGGLVRERDIFVPVTPEQVEAGFANREAWEAETGFDREKFIAGIITD